MKRNVFLLGFVLFVSSFLFGCAVAPKNLSDGASIKDESGILVVGLHTDWEGHNNPMLTSLTLNYIGEGESGFDYRKLVFQGENHVTVIELPAKKYRFYMESFGNRYVDFDESSEFVIKPNTITYIGDITSNVAISGFSTRFSLKVEGRLDDIKAYLNQKTPKLLLKYGVEEKLVPLKVKQ